jgi:hypothetical protein
VLRVHGEVTERRGVDHAERVHVRAELGERPDQLGAVGLVAEVRGLDHRERLASQ